jgi:hypothetical protein
MKNALTVLLGKSYEPGPGPFLNFNFLFSLPILENLLNLEEITLSKAISFI